MRAREISPAPPPSWRSMHDSSSYSLMWILRRRLLNLITMFNTLSSSTKWLLCFEQKPWNCTTVVNTISISLAVRQQRKTQSGHLSRFREWWHHRTKKSWFDSIFVNETALPELFTFASGILHWSSLPRKMEYLTNPQLTTHRGHFLVDA